MVWFANWTKPLAWLGLYRYSQWRPGQPLRILLVGYNGARNTGADARVVALTQQLEQALGAESSKLTVMTLDTENMNGYFPLHIKLWRFTTMFVFSLLRACSCHHVAVLCEGSMLTPTFSEALCVFFCEAAGIMRRQHKPCIAYGSEVGRLSGWLAKLSRDMCRDTYFIVRTRESLDNLQVLGLRGHIGTDTAWTFDCQNGEAWARKFLKMAGWDGHQPLLGIAPINPFCWPVRPSLWRWVKALVTRDFSQQYDKFYFYSDSPERRRQYKRYLEALAAAADIYSQEYGAFVVILGIEKLDKKVCSQLSMLIDCRHTVFTSYFEDVFHMTGLLRQLSILLTSRYHAAVLSMESAVPIVAVSIDARLQALMRELDLDYSSLLQATDADLKLRIIQSLRLNTERQALIAMNIRRHVAAYKTQVNNMSQFFKSWLERQFS